MISVFQQCKRPEINLYLPDDIRSLVDNMDTNGLRIAVCDFMLTSNHPKVKTFKERYETLDGSELPWEQLWGFGNRGMKNSAVWADQNFMQGTAWLLGVDIKILNSVSRNGIINYLTYSGNLEEENVPSIVPPMTIGYRTRCHFQSLLPLEINDGGAATIKELNDKNSSILNQNETIDISDDEKDKTNIKPEDKISKPAKISESMSLCLKTENDSEEVKKIKSFKRNVKIVNEDNKEFLGNKEKDVKKLKIENPKIKKVEDITANIEEVRDISRKKNCATIERTFSDESISSIKSCSSKISVQSDDSDFININDLFSKPSVFKGNYFCYL